ncbi:MAG: leucine-rich repeat domain-containing protein, partial [Treponema sp.]|nr:leucine-rich repeat domain-containing protein [Treponema sp.]
MNKKGKIFCLIILTVCFAGCPDYGPFNVYYHGDSGTTGSPPRDGAGYLYGEVATILGKPDNFAKGDKAFLGWKEEYSSFIYNAGDTITISGDIHLYAQWEGDEANAFTYTIDPATKEVTITGYNADYWDGVVIIPSSIKPDGETAGCPVAHIGNDAFYNRYVYELALPDTLKTIGNKAFASASLSGELSIPDSVVSIGDLAFQGNWISRLELGDGLQTIGAYAFDANNITTLSLPPNVLSIEKGAFDGNPLTLIRIGGGVAIESDNALGLYGKSFRALYAEKSAGFYMYEKGKWVVLDER